MKTNINNDNVIHVLGFFSHDFDDSGIEDSLCGLRRTFSCTFLTPTEPRDLLNKIFREYDILLFDCTMLNDDWWFYLSSFTYLPILFLSDTQIDARILEAVNYGIHDFITVDNGRSYLQRLPHRLLKTIYIYNELEQEQILTETLDTSSDAVVIVRSIGDDLFSAPIVFGNQRFKSQICQNPNATNTTLHNCLNLDENPKSKSSLRSIILEGRYSSINIKLKKKDGEENWFKVNMRTIYNSFHHYEYKALHFNDITKSKQYEQDLIESKVIAEQAKASEQLFLATMSHEIRTPITSIMGLTKLIGRTELNYEQQEYLSSIESSVEILIALVNDILDLSKIEKGAVELSMIDFDLRSLCNTLARPFRQNAYAKGLFFNYFFDNRISSAIAGDKIRINQILLNLIGNAIKYTREGEINFKISLVEELEDHYMIRFEVSDTGEGIAQEELPLIFEKYKQLKQKGNITTKGTGLGLYIVQNLVKILGGEIEVTSELRVGSKFAFTLPMKKGSNQGCNQIDESKANLNNAKILVIEDNELNRNILVKQLESLSAIPIGVANGAEAIPILSGLNNIDLVLIDLNMPVLNGVDTIKIVRNILDSKVPIIVLSANEQENSMFQEIRPYVNDALSKPYKIEDLIEKTGKYTLDNGKIDIPEQSFSIHSLMEISNNNEAFTHKMIQTTYNLIAEASDNFAKAIEKEDLNTIETYSHKTKSTASIFKAKAIYKLCELVEMTSKENNTDLTLPLTRALRIKCERILFELDNSYPLLDLKTPVS